MTARHYAAAILLALAMVLALGLARMVGDAVDAMQPATDVQMTNNMDGD